MVRNFPVIVSALARFIGRSKPHTSPIVSSWKTTFTHEKFVASVLRRRCALARGKRITVTGSDRAGADAPRC